MAPTSSSAKVSRVRDARCSRTPASSAWKVSSRRCETVPIRRSVPTTCIQRETLTIAGFALDEGKWDGIYVGRRKGDDLIYAGKVDHGFDKASAADLQKILS
jgi:hypothetical protein